MTQMRFMALFLYYITFLLPTSVAFGKEIFTNNVRVPSPPSWLTVSRVEKVTARVQGILEWDIIRVTVYFYTDAAAFERVHNLGSAVIAYSRPEDNSVHMGPKVGTGNFDRYFGHELTHVVIAQKYKTAIPKWLDEGLANYVGKIDVDYAWLAAQPARDVTGLTHPFDGDFRYHYAASTAVMEMIASKCSLKDLLQLSVGAKLETYLDTYCGIPNVNATFREWLAAKGKKKA
jgi:hypothetical protein